MRGGIGDVAGFGKERISGAVKSLREEQAGLTTASLIVIAAVAGAAALIYTRPVMVPFVLSIFVYYLVAPLADFLEGRLRLPRWGSTAVSIVVVIGLLALVGLLITTSTLGLLESADVYRERITRVARQMFSVLDRWGLDLGQQSLLQAIQQIPVLTLIRSGAGTVFGLVTNGFLVLIFVIFLLIGRQADRELPRLYAEIDAKIRRYIVTKVVISASTGLLVGVILWSFGLDLALVFGVLTFLLNFIPSVGSIIATLLPIPVALVQFETPARVAAIIVLPAIVQMVIGNGIEPKVMGEGLDLHPITILLALVFWGLLWGVVGMLLAAPITAVLRIALARFETTRVAADLLAGRLPEPPRATVAADTT